MLNNEWQAAERVQGVWGIGQVKSVHAHIDCKSRRIVKLSPKNSSEQVVEWEDLQNARADHSVIKPQPF